MALFLENVSYFCGNFPPPMALFFTKQEIRGIALLVPLLLITLWIVVEALSSPSSVGSAESNETASAPSPSLLRPFDPNCVTYEELRAMGVEKYAARGIIRYREGGRTFAIPEDVAIVYGISDSLYATLKPFITIGEEYRPKPRNYPSNTTSSTSSASRRRTFRAIPFDPNALTAEGFYELGCFTARQAEAMVEYRERIGGFRTLLDFADCYLIDSALYAQMKPYITISASAQSTPSSAPRSRTFQAIPFDPNTLTAEGFYELGCFTARQAEALVEYRTRRGGFRTALEWRDCYLIDSALWEQTKDYLRLSPIPKSLTELNGADSLALVALPGIGPATASEIIAYRNRLGGYHSVAQLLDLKVVSAENYALFAEEIWCDSCKIRKIDINFAAPKELAAHPYVTTPRLRKILIERQKRGGWKGPEEFKEAQLFDTEVVDRLTPYFRFTAPEIE